MKVRDILALCDGIAPFALAEEWDNPGLLLGREDSETDTILVTLDMSRDVLEEAAGLGAGVILAHHPILFRGTKNLSDRTEGGRLLLDMASSGIAYIAMHTNYDAAPDGVNLCLAKRLGAGESEALPCGMRVFGVKGTLGEFASLVSERLAGPVRVYGDKSRRLTRAAVMGGSGGQFVPDAAHSGADVFVTGEIGYHTALDACAEGLCVIEAGHYETERGAMIALADRLNAPERGVKAHASRSLYR